LVGISSVHRFLHETLHMLIVCVRFRRLGVSLSKCMTSHRKCIYHNSEYFEKGMGVDVINVVTSLRWGCTGKVLLTTLCLRGFKIGRQNVI